VRELKTKVLFLTVALALLALVGVATATSIRAEEISDYPPIIQKLVERFNLNPSEVQEVFNQEREERQEERQTRLEERLNEAVQNGEITEEQKQLILTKHQELQQERETNREAVQNMTREEHQAAMEAERAELEAWAEENGIDLNNFFFGSMGPKGGHPGWGGFKFGNE
jgi:pyoverdine/dityrosine biosynthesis protein Dit1